MTRKESDAPKFQRMAGGAVTDAHIGARGIGEITATGVAPAIANAIYHATGRRIRELPITPDKLL
jgi:CO/xanthine dehydrogenase Mo-binding subunit